jgi:NDP-sugar pyrophosphorylase family protein
LRKQGFRDVIVSIGFLGQQIIDFVGDGSDFDLNVRYVADGDTPIGTGGAVKKALRVTGSPSFVLYGDTLLDVSYWEVESAFQNFGFPVLMTVLKNGGRWDRSNVLFTTERNILYEKCNQTHKMNYIDYGLSIFSESAFEEFQGEGLLDLADVCAKLSKQSLIGGWEVYNRFYEIGSKSGLKDAERFLEKGRYR